MSTIWHTCVLNYIYEIVLQQSIADNMDRSSEYGDIRLAERLGL